MIDNGSSIENDLTRWRWLGAWSVQIMAFCFKIYGASYLHNLLQPLLKPLLEEPSRSFEVGPARLDAKEDLTDNRTNLVTLTQRVFGAIVSSADKFPPQLRSMCHCLYQV